MEWRDQGYVLSARRHGESAAIVSLFTHERGRHVGLVRGGSGARARGIYQPGNALAAHWRARLAEHLGTMTAELVRSHAAAFLDDPMRLAVLSAACAVLDAALPEREPHPRLYDGFGALLAFLEQHQGWCEAYVRWELAVLEELGYGLDLSACAATGQTHDLVYVSPRSGRAVSAAAGRPYRRRLLPLPAFLAGGGAATEADIAAGLALTGHFLGEHLFAGQGVPIPAARTRLVDRICRRPPISSGNMGP